MSLFNNTNEGGASLVWQVCLFILMFFYGSGSLYAQWVNNPSVNTKLVVDAVNPINISSVEDSKGGAFIIWEENKNSFQSDVYFLHVDGNGKVSFRADGKKISDNEGTRSDPAAASSLPNTAVIVYKDYTYRKTGDLFVQKVLNNGNFLWQRNGVRITNTDMELNDYTITSDSKGNAYVAYLLRDVNATHDYQIFIQKLDQNGKPVFAAAGIKAYQSPSSVTQPVLISDTRGGVFIFWLENSGNKSVIYAEKVDSSGNLSWGRKPLNISGMAKSVISYSVKVTDFGSIYVAWQVQNKDKDIYHQLLTGSGKVLWDAGGRLATQAPGDQVNPQVLAEDSSIVLSWTNEASKDRNIYIQKYNRQGRPLWKSNGFPVIELKGPQWGQKLISDGKGGAIVAWIDRRVDSMRANIYAQRVTTRGQIAWDEDAIPVAFNHNSEKSYLSVVSDRRGGAIFIFRDRRSGKGEIYGQKIFNTGTYISQLIGFTAETVSDSVRISWYSANEMGETQYDIERTTQSDSSSTDWSLIGTIYSDGTSSAKYYEYYDRPDIAGTIYYRVVQSDDKGNFQPSDVAKLNFIESAADIVIGQNSPNPFNGETVIEFYLPQEEYVTVDFFNSRVEEIKKIDNKLYPAGKNQLFFSSEGLQPGIYFYRFKIGDFVDVKKMVVTQQ